MAESKAMMRAKGSLTAAEQTRLQELECVIDTGLDAFLEVGRALLDIRKEKLWKPHKSFQDYLAARWPEMCRSRAYQVMQYAEIYDAVSTIVDTDALRESHTRELASFPRHLHGQIAERAVELAGAPERLTAPIINRAGLEIMDRLSRAADGDDEDGEEGDDADDADDDGSSSAGTSSIAAPTEDALAGAARSTDQPVRLHPLLRAAEHHRLGRKDSKKTLAEDMDDPKLREAAETLAADLEAEAAWLRKLLG